ncbi:hypothetical protein ATK36_3293 [Amycolatopsis sulphurea]|uniref:Uncharacterized protein n=1 Tax=Amycolatopsis sulphurea TaxID=76022 RepID=A0A2A9FBP4_9PSEU|nr:hypothetical protein [Amycolatopsis sulphurea]PFG48216.1 hypothetical protein ATK36_3293 [Amycolatopsis sulphurea]
MSTPGRSRGAFAAARGLLLAVSSASLTVTAHVAGDGGLPDPALTLLLTGLLGWTGTALARRVRGRLATLAVLGGGQVVMHLVLTTLNEHQHGSPASWTMTAAHAAATLLTALLLARADAVLLGLLQLLRAILPALSPPLPVPAAAGVPLPPPVEATALRKVDLHHVRCRRGPPRRS